MESGKTQLRTEHNSNQLATRDGVNRVCYWKSLWNKAMKTNKTYWKINKQHSRWCHNSDISVTQKAENLQNLQKLQ